MFKRDAKSFYMLAYISACLITVIGFAFGYLYTTGKVRNDKAAEIGSYEGIKTEYNAGLDTETQNVSTRNIVSEDTLITKRTKYKVCGHTITESDKAASNMVGLTEMQIRTAFTDWNIEKFSPDEVIINREVNEKCPEHYIVKEREGMVAVYYQRPINGVLLKEVTNIPVVNLIQAEQIRLKQGIEVNSNQALAEILEDFGS